MRFQVLFHASFVPEWKSFPIAAKERIGEVLDLLEEEGPSLGRPDVDHLSGSRHRNMKEIRVRLPGQIWRLAFAFDPEQRAIILCGGEKQGINQSHFYRRLIAKADSRLDEWIGARS